MSMLDVIGSGKNINKISFTSVNITSQATNNGLTEKKIDLPSNVANDYNVKVPQSYNLTSIEKLSNGQKLYCYKLANGQKVIIAPMKCPNTYVNTYVNTGSMNEKDEERGISHFTEHMAFNGTFGTNGFMKLGNSDVFNKVAEMGGYTNACTGMNGTYYTISIPQFNKEDLENAISIQSSMMNNLEMSDEMIKKEQGPVCSEINMYSDIIPVKSNNIALKQLYNIKSTSEDPVAGTVKNIKNLDRQKVMDYYKNNYYPANMTTVITGDVNPDDAITLVAKHFNGTNKQNPDRRFEKLSPIEKSVRQDLFSDKTKKTISTVAFNGPANNNIKDQLAMSVIINMLEKPKFTSSLKEIGTQLVPSITKVSTIPSEGAVIAFDMESIEENSEKSLDILFRQLNNFKIDENELQQIKNMMKSDSQDLYENPEEINRMIGDSIFNNDISSLSKENEILDSLTIEDVENAAKKYLDTSKASVAVVHPSSTTTNDVINNYNKVNNKQISFKGNIDTKPLDVNKSSNLKLSNNYDLLFYDTPMNSNAKVNITYLPKEPINAKPGVRELLGQLLNEKTAYKDIDTFNEYLDKNSVKQELLIFSGGKILISGNVPSNNIDKFFAITQEQLMLPFFDEQELNKQKEILKARCENKIPDAYNAIEKEIFGSKNFKYTSKDILDNIDSITIKDLQDYYTQIMENSAATVTVAAPMTDRKVIDTTVGMMSKMPSVNLSGYKTYDLYKQNDVAKVFTEVVPNSQAEIVQAYNFLDSGNVKDDISISLMNWILYSGEDTGLFNNLREKEKLAYRVSSEYYKSGNSGVILCNILTTTDNKEIGEQSFDNVQKSINGFTRQINNMKNGEFTDKELEVAKKKFLNNLQDGMYGQQKIADTLSENTITPYGINKINEEFDAINKITRQDIINAANYVFKEKPIYSIVASEDTINANKQYLDNLVKESN